MLLTPTSFDVWAISQLVHLLRRHPLFDLCIQGGIQHNLLGGVWYAVARFYSWVRGNQAGKEEARHPVLTTFWGSMVAIALMLLAGEVVEWLRPIRYPTLAHLCPGYIDPGPDLNSFPSQSTTLYAAVACGVVLLIGLPRIYVSMDRS